MSGRETVDDREPASQFIGRTSGTFSVFLFAIPIKHRAYIEGVSRRNAFWRLDSEFRVVLQIQSLWPKIGKIWTLDLESSINFDSKSRVVHPF